MGNVWITWIARDAAHGSSVGDAAHGSSLAPDKSPWRIFAIRWAAAVRLRSGRLVTVEEP